MLKNNILTLLFCCVIQLNAQELLFNRLTSENGLAPGAVLCIAQDAKGFMWFGTQNGLTRFDTHRFKIYKQDSPISDAILGNYITRLLLDSKNNLWVGTRNGLNVYNRETDQLDQTKLPVKKSSQYLNISCIYEDREKNIWIWSSAGLFLQKKNTLKQFEYIAIPDSIAGLATNNNIRTIYQDHMGCYWIGSSVGLTCMKWEKGKIIFKSFRHNPGDKSSISDNYVTAIVEDPANNLWVGTQQGGLNLFNRTLQTFKSYQATAADGLVNNNVRELKIDPSGRLWIGTQGGVSVYSSQTRQFKNYRSDPNKQQTLSHNSVYSIFFDHQNTVWIGTYWGGVNSIAQDATPFHSYGANSNGQGINNSVVSGIAEDKTTHNLLVGTEGGGLNLIDRKTQKIKQFTHHTDDNSSIGSDLVKVIYKDQDGNFWVGTHGGGLNLFNPTKQHFTRLLYTANDPIVRNAEVLAICESSAGIFWIGTQTGLQAFKRLGHSLQALPQNKLTKIIGTRTVKSILQTANGDLWIGTSSGLFLVKHDKVQQLSLSKQLSAANINCIHEDKSSGKIWIGSASRGLFQYDPKAKKTQFIQYTKRNGLPDDNIAAILADDYGSLWISTGNGLCKLDKQKIIFKNYNKTDGLAGNIFNINSAYKSSSGELLFGGYNGLTFFHPEDIKGNPFAPPTFLTGLKLFDQEVHVGEPDGLLNKEISHTEALRFTNRQNVFTLEFATLNYVQPNKNRYAYKLEGFDDTWNYTDLPAATYMNLPSGKYLFLVKGTNNDSLWGKTTSIQITVLPPFWKTIWAYLFYTLFVASIVFLLIRFFVLRSLVKHDQELTQLKLDFFTNISHEMRSRLSLIMGPVEKMLLINRENNENIRQLRIIRKSSESLLHLLTELMDFRRAESGNLRLHPAKQDLVRFLQEIFFTFEDWAIVSGIRSEFHCRSTAVEIYFDRVQLEKVFYNIYFNAYKFTPSGGYVVTQIQEKKHTIVITIWDNGKGVSPENLSKIFTNYFQEDDQSTDNKGYGIGLALAKSIVELHHGTITVNSSRGEDGNITLFTITLRKGDRLFSVETDLEEDAGDTEYEPRSYLFNNVPVASETIMPESMVDEISEERYTILMIEDNEDILRMNRELLEKNYKIVTCTNGLEGWEAAIELIPDIIVSDVMMPGLDGYTLCSRLKMDERTDHIPVILLTAMASSSQQINGLQQGAAIYITKPFSVEALALQISNLLSLREKMHRQRAKQLALPSQEAIKTDKVADPFLDKVILIIEQHLDDPSFTIDTIAKQLSMSRPILYKKLQVLTGLTVNDFVKAIRMKKAVEYLENNTFNISDVAYKVGYSDLKYFSREFKKYFGKTPRDWRRNDLEGD